MAAPAYYWVRLHFAEILYTVPAVRIFSVYIDGVNVLPNFTLPLINTAVTKEIYVPVTSSSLNVTFLRGALGDPMVNAIEIIQAYNTSQTFDDLYALQPTSGQALATELRLICGLNSTTFGPDAEGRVWESDSSAGSGVVITPLANTEVLGVNSTVSDTAPIYTNHQLLGCHQTHGREGVFIFTNEWRLSNHCTRFQGL